MRLGTLAQEPGQWGEATSAIRAAPGPLRSGHGPNLGVRRFSPVARWRVATHSNCPLPPFVGPAPTRRRQRRHGSADGAALAGWPQRAPRLCGLVQQRPAVRRHRARAAAAGGPALPIGLGRWPLSRRHQRGLAHRPSRGGFARPDGQHGLGWAMSAQRRAGLAWRAGLAALVPTSAHRHVRVGIRPLLRWPASSPQGQACPHFGPTARPAIPCKPAHPTPVPNICLTGAKVQSQADLKGFEHEAILGSATRQAPVGRITNLSVGPQAWWLRAHFAAGEPA